LFLTDGFKEYRTALLAHFGQWVQPSRRQTIGPAPKPRWMPRPELCYAQVVKSYRRRRLVRVRHHVVFGTLAAVKQVLTAQGWQINTRAVKISECFVLWTVTIVIRASTAVQSRDTCQCQTRTPATDRQPLRHTADLAKRAAHWLA
jgi:hypothetical protein